MNTFSCLSLILFGIACVACASTPNPRSASAAPQPIGPAAANHDEATSIAEGRRWTAAFYARETQLMWDHMDDPLRKLLGDKAGLDAFREQIANQLGAEKELVEETVKRERGASLYLRVAKFTKSSQRFLLVIGLSDGRVTSFGIKPASDGLPAETTKHDYETNAPLRLPFAGTWTVAWGGRTKAENQHIIMRDQRFAYDFIVVESGSTHRGDGTENTDYFCHGRPILAPAAGRVSAAIDGIPENDPGQMDGRHPAGNYVIVDHGHDEFSLLAHLVPGSLTVKPGDSVASGQVLGQCGNSGHSSEPHLHYHLQNGPTFGDADGLPAQFRNYRADGNAVAQGEPVRGQTIEAASAVPAKTSAPGKKKARSQRKAPKST